MNHKPMLAVDCGDIETVKLPVFASPKLDGIRCIITAQGALSRKLLPLPNVNVQSLLEGLPVGLDGELIAGDPTAPDAYRKTVSMVMSDDKPVRGLVFHVFDLQLEAVFQVRYARLCDWFYRHTPHTTMVEQTLIHSLPVLLEMEEKTTAAGYEGLILRAPRSPYKHGRSTEKQGYLLKVKRFVDGEAEVIGVTELMHNGNAATVDETGHTKRGHKKEGMVPAGVMGTLVVRDVKTGVEFEIGTGFTADERADIWQNPPDTWQGWLVKYKHFPVGAKDKPRHPVFLGWRDRRDI